MDDFEALLSQFEATAEETAPKEEPPKPAILVVDDDQSIRRALGRVFADRYDVLTAESGSQGVEILSEAVHCVILDVKMKEENGFTAYPKLKAKSPDVPIIFYTAFQSEHDLQEVINKCKPERYVDKGLLGYHEGTTFARVLTWGPNAILPNFKDLWKSVPAIGKLYKEHLA
jgi:CheY-like chemotaxis protein